MYNAPHSLRDGLEAGVRLSVLEVVGQAAEHQHSHQHQREQQSDVLCTQQHEAKLKLVWKA